MAAADHPTSQALAIRYRARAKAWREDAAALPQGAPQQANYLEIADGYEGLAACYERRARLQQGLEVAVSKGAVQVLIAAG